MRWIVPSLALLAISFAHASDPGVLSYAGCEHRSGESNIRFEGDLLLNQKFLGKGKLGKETVEAAIRLQLRYLSGYFNNSSRKQVRLVISEPATRIENYSLRPGTYGSSLEVDDLKHPEYKTDNEYQLRAIKRGHTTSEDPAWTVHYVVSILAAICERDEKPATELSLYLPKDPYLFYWSVKPADRRDIQWNNSSWNVNPCADPEVADLPHPLYFWYFWDPKYKGRDKQGRWYDCSKLLKEGESYVRVSLRTAIDYPPRKTAYPLRLDLLPKDRELRASVYFGIIDPKSRVFPVQEMVKYLGSEIKGGVSPNPSTRLREFVKSKIFSEDGKIDWRFDRGTKYFSSFLYRLDSVMKLNNLEIRNAGKQEVTLMLSGELLDSHSPISLQIFFGPTDVFGPVSPSHWQPLLSSLSKDDIVLYVGHSGLGHNFNLRELGSALQLNSADLATKTQASHYQLIGFLACYTYSYFGADVVDQRKDSVQTTPFDLVYTGTEFSSERGPLGILNSVDQYRKSKFQAESSLSRPGFLRDEDFIIVKQYGLTSQE